MDEDHYMPLRLKAVLRRAVAIRPSRYEKIEAIVGDVAGAIVTSIHDT
jgi:hypothetical protein